MWLTVGNCMQQFSYTHCEMLWNNDDDDEEDLMYSPALMARRASESWIDTPPVEVDVCSSWIFWWCVNTSRMNHQFDICSGFFSYRKSAFRNNLVCVLQVFNVATEIYQGFLVQVAADAVVNVFVDVRSIQVLNMSCSGLKIAWNRQEEFEH